MADAADSTETNEPVPPIVVPPDGAPEILDCPSCKKTFAASPKEREGNCPHCNAPLAFLSEKEYQALLEAEERKKAFQQKAAQKRAERKAAEEEQRRRLEERRLKQGGPGGLRLVGVLRRSKKTAEGAAAAGAPTPWREKDRPVADIEGVGETYAAKLTQSGIGTVQQLEAADATLVARVTEAPEATVRQWQAMAELIDVDGVGPQVAELLVRSGVHSIPALARCDPKELAQRVERTQAERQTAIQGGPSGAKSVKKWIKAARKHPLADQPERRPGPPEALLPPVAPEPSPAPAAPVKAAKRGKKEPSPPVPAPAVEPPATQVAAVAEPLQLAEETPKKGFFARLRREKKAPADAPAPAEAPATVPAPAPEPAPEAPKKGRKERPAKEPPAPAVEPAAAVVETSIDLGTVETAPVPSQPAAKRGLFGRLRKQPSPEPEAPPTAATVEVGSIDFGSVEATPITEEKRPAKASASKRKR